MFKNFDCCIARNKSFYKKSNLYLGFDQWRGELLNLTSAIDITTHLIDHPTTLFGRIIYYLRKSVHAMDATFLVLCNDVQK